MDREDAAVILADAIALRGEMSLADAVAALLTLGFANEDIQAVLVDGIGRHWLPRRSRGTWVFRAAPAKAQGPANLPWETADDAAECWCCGAEGATRTREGTRICELCWVVLDIGSAT